MTEEASASSELSKIAKLNGDFRKNYGTLLGAVLYLRSISAARGSSPWSGLIAAISHPDLGGEVRAAMAVACREDVSLRASVADLDYMARCVGDRMMGQCARSAKELAAKSAAGASRCAIRQNVD